MALQSHRAANGILSPPLDSVSRRDYRIESFPAVSSLGKVFASPPRLRHGATPDRALPVADRSQCYRLSRLALLVVGCAFSGPFGLHERVPQLPKSPDQTTGADAPSKGAR